MRTILLKLAGPMQSWGTDSHFEIRHTDRYPSKSAVIGIIAASLGYRRDDDDKIVPLNELEFAVRVDQEGSLLSDYHTAVKYKVTKGQVDVDRTYVTNRYYIEDAVYIVAVGSSNNDLLDSVYHALKNPYFQPFMGRRSLPVPADFVFGTSEEGVIGSLKNLPLQANSWYQKKHSKRIPIFADSTLLENEVTNMRKDRVVSFSQKSRMFGFRGESCIWIDAKGKQLDSKHDAFSAVGGV